MTSFLLLFIGVCAVLAYMATIVWLGVDAPFKGARLVAMLLIALGVTIQIRLMQMYL